MNAQQTSTGNVPTGTQGRDIPGHAGAVARFLVCFVLFAGGIVLMGSAMSFDVAGEPSASPWLFAGGIVASTLGFLIPLSAGNRER